MQNEIQSNHYRNPIIKNARVHINCICGRTNIFWFRKDEKLYRIWWKCNLFPDNWEKVVINHEESTSVHQKWQHPPLQAIIIIDDGEYGQQDKCEGPDANGRESMYPVSNRRINGKTSTAPGNNSSTPSLNCGENQFYHQILSNIKHISSHCHFLKYFQSLLASSLIYFTIFFLQQIIYFHISFDTFFLLPKVTEMEINVVKLICSHVFLLWLFLPFIWNIRFE